MKSMTGYGRAVVMIENDEYTFELKSVNNRYLDVNVRLPRAYAFLEDAVKKEVGQHITRGKVDVYLTVRKLAGDTGEVVLNRELLKGYLAAVNDAVEEFGLKNDVGVSSALRFPEVLELRAATEDEDELTERVMRVTREALADYDAMREREGESLALDLAEKLTRLEEIRAEIEKLSPASVENYEKRLRERIEELLGRETLDESRLLTEVAIFADKVAVDEELCRLSSHFRQFRDIMKSRGAIGKKLDFLVQEINREINTTGSKCSELEITRLVVEAKSELEKIREQIQNIE
ncbi:MAG: YicC family protein [Clostridia bacterium]|nr:YicC family protein [Clostridia bacterium]